jgi:signal transduction histidine kinase
VPVLSGLHPEPDELRDFEVATREAAAIHWPIIALGAAIAAFLWWFTDSLLYQDSPEVREAFYRFRLGIIVCNVFLVATVPRSPGLLKRWDWVVGLGLAMQSAWIGSCFGPVPGLFPFLYPIPLMTVVMLVPLRSRVVWASVTSASAWLAAYVPAPSPGLESLRQLNFLVFTTVLAIGLGHLVYSLARGQFVLRQRLSKHGRHLAQLAGALEERVAEQAGLLLELNRQAAEERLIERARVARDLHDGLGQELTGVRLVVGALLAGARGHEERAALQDVVVLLERGHEVLRRSLHDLTPSALEEHGLVLAIRHMVEELAARGGLRAEIELDPLQETVPRPLAVAVFRVVQEALSNVIKHASASTVKVTLRCTDASLDLVIADDGVGLSPGRMDQPSQFGLVGIRARVAALGGAVNLHGEGGTRVSVHLPLVPPATGARPA